MITYQYFHSIKMEQITHMTNTMNDSNEYAECENMKTKQYTLCNFIYKMS